jgi:proline iminopeptidase
MRIKIIITIFLLLLLSLVNAQTIPNSLTDGKYYTINGKKLWTLSFGAGDPLFIISGGPGAAHTSLRTLDTLASISTLVYYDGFGRGKSDTADVITDYSLNRDIEDLEGLRMVMGFEKINVLGHSYGSLVAQGYAIKYHENVNHLILSGACHSYVMWQENCDNCNREIKMHYPELWDSLMTIRAQGFVSSEPIHYNLYNQIPLSFFLAYNPENYNNPNPIKYPNQFNIKLYYQMVGKDGDFKIGSDIDSFDFRGQLKDLTMPVLILAGRYDRVCIPRMMVQYKEFCPQAEFHMFEKSGHRTFIEEPDKTFELIINFLTK